MKRIFITIYILMLICLFAIPFSIGPIIDEIFEDEATKLDRDIAKGTFYLLSEQLKDLDETGKRAHLAKLQPHFGYPLGLYKIDEMDIDEEDRDDFLNNLVVEEDEKEMLIQRLGNSDLVLTMGGPFPGGELEVKVIIIFWGLFIVALILPSLAWALFLNRDIRKIEKSSRQFTSGDHTARVKVSKISSMVQIAAAFNRFAENTQKMLESQKQIANSVSHEIRTPLARIKFSLEMISDVIASGSPDKDYLREISRDVEEIESLVDEILTYARFGRERESSEALIRQEMVSWLTSILEAERKNNPTKKITFTPQGSEVEFFARCEPVYLGWAVRNLIRNAAVHAQKEIIVTLEPEKSSFYIHIDDDGPGIPEKIREKIFEPFYRADKSRNRTSGGYGLGLAIAKRIAVWHNGSITVGTSALGGARFSLCLPLSS